MLSFSSLPLLRDFGIIVAMNVAVALLSALVILPPMLVWADQRNWVSKGLVKPERTAAGYRKFSGDDVSRLRYILLMQRDHYLPLKVIGEHLDAIDRGHEPPAIESVVPTVPKVALSADGLPSPESFRRTSDLRLSRRELLKVADISEELLAQLEQFGLVSARTGTGCSRRRECSSDHRRYRDRG